MPTELINYDDIIAICKSSGIDITWRKLNFYKSLGLLPKSERKPGDKRGYYPYEVIYYLRVYYLLQQYLNFTLKEIKELIDSKGIIRKAICEFTTVSYGIFLRRVFAKKSMVQELDTIELLLYMNNSYKKFLMKGNWDPSTAKRTGREWATIAYKKLEYLKKSHEIPPPDGWKQKLYK